MLIMMPLAGFLVSRVDPRMMMGFGFATTSGALYLHGHASEYGDAISAPPPSMRVLQTAGLAFIFLPSNTLAYVGIPREQNNQVSGMNAFVRNIGGSIGIALLSTMLTRVSQQNQNTLVRHTHTGNPGIRQSGQRNQPVLAECRPRSNGGHAAGLRARHGNVARAGDHARLRAGDHPDGDRRRLPDSSAHDHAQAAQEETSR